MTSRRQRTAGALDASAFRFAIVISDYHPAVSRRLLDGALQCFDAHRAEPRGIPVFRVPGAFEIPQAASRILARTAERYDALVCLGVLIRGETLHFEILAREVCRGLAEIGLSTGVPLAFGVLTVENEQQARDRSGKGAANKGWEAAQAAIRMAALYRELDEVPAGRGENRRRKR